MPSYIRRARPSGLPEDLRRELIEERRKRGWSQAELGQRLGLPQMHISGIETGKVVPRFDTLLEMVRILGYDLLLAPRSLVPALQAMIRDQQRPDSGAGMGERPLYAMNPEDEDEPR